MSESYDVTSLKDKLQKGSTAFVVFGGSVTIDHVAASLSLFLALRQAGIDTIIASPSEMQAGMTHIVGLDKVTKSIGNRNLVISFKDYTAGSIEKVSHNDDINNKFELTIQPKSGEKAPNPKNIDYYYTGAQADLIFIVGTSRLEDLGSIYENNNKLFHDVESVAINRHQSSTYASVNVIDNNASSLSEIVSELIPQLGLTISPDAASNLIAGIDYATNRFQNPVISADAFSAVGRLLALGGKRRPAPIKSSSTSLSGRKSPFANLPANHPFAKALASSTAPSQTTQPINPFQPQSPQQSAQFSPPPTSLTPNPSNSGQSQTLPPVGQDSSTESDSAQTQKPTTDSQQPTATPQIIIPPETSAQKQSQSRVPSPESPSTTQEPPHPAETSQPQDSESSPNPEPQDANDQDAPKEWTKPKIYKGSTKV